MMRTAVALAVAAIVALGATTRAQQESESNVAKIRAVVGEYLAARERRDAEAIGARSTEHRALHEAVARLPREHRHPRRAGRPGHRDRDGGVVLVTTDERVDQGHVGQLAPAGSRWKDADAVGVLGQHLGEPRVDELAL